MHGGEPLLPPDIFAVSLAAAEALGAGYDLTETRLGNAALALAQRTGMPWEAPAPLVLPRLGPNDHAAFDLFSRGVPTAEVKERLKMAERTLWLAFARIRDRTGTRTNPQLARRLMEAGLLASDPPHPDNPQPEWLDTDEFLLLGLGSRGWTTKNIGDNLGAPRGWVGDTNASSYSKLLTYDGHGGHRAEYATHAVRRALSLNWLVPDAVLIDRSL